MTFIDQFLDGCGTPGKTAKLSLYSSTGFDFALEIGRMNQGECGYRVLAVCRCLGGRDAHSDGRTGYLRGGRSLFLDRTRLDRRHTRELLRCGACRFRPAIGCLFLLGRRVSRGRRGGGRCGGCCRRLVGSRSRRDLSLP